MAELSFLGSLALIVLGGFFLFRSLSRKDRHDRSRKELYRPTQADSSRVAHRNAGHRLVHSHAAPHLNSKDDLWRTSRVKVNESHWETNKQSTFVAHKLRSDFEAGSSKKESSHGLAMPTVEFTPVEPPHQPKKSVRGAGSKRA